MIHRSFPHWLDSIAVASVVCIAERSSAQPNRGTEYRSLNTDIYHIAIQKNTSLHAMSTASADRSCAMSHVRALR